MNPSGYIKRTIYAIIACVIVVFVLNGAVAAFAPTLFTTAQLSFVDVLIFLLGLCYVIWGETLFK
jgi:hypothetical protein